MTPSGWFLIGLVLVVPPLVYLEGKRQQRKYGRPSGRGNLAGAGLLELQRHLEPERKIEAFREEKLAEKKEGEGDPPDPGKSQGTGPPKG